MVRAAFLLHDACTDSNARLKMAVKNCFIRGSVVRYVQLPAEHVDTQLLEDATRRGAFILIVHALRSAQADVSYLPFTNVQRPPCRTNGDNLATEPLSRPSRGVSKSAAGALMFDVYSIPHLHVFFTINCYRFPSLFTHSNPNITSITITAMCQL